MGRSGRTGGGRRNGIDPIALADRAAGRLGLVGTTDLRECGFDRFAVARAVATARLHAQHPGVYSVGHAGLAADARLVAATMAVGDGSAISHRSAAAWWGLRPAASTIEVTTGCRDGRSALAGVVVHRSRRMADGDVVGVGPVRVTTPSRTLVDLAAVAPVERALHLALARNLVTGHALRTYVKTRAAGRTGVRALRLALDRAHPEVHRTRSELERLALRLLARTALPAPRVNAVRTVHEVDLVWDVQRVIVELDGYGHHRSAAALNTDLRRANDLQAAGWVMRRFTWWHLTRDPGWFVATVADAIGSSA